ncbi:hypothetical protein BDW74DRAFT_163034 [Aspergillus multicolor]|uniref:uncharacterized protein n=1 Tax=Aspergillus multicolor TaxID=41759 RepID=UPI003CCD838F
MNANSKSVFYWMARNIYAIPGLLICSSDGALLIHVDGQRQTRHHLKIFRTDPPDSRSFL